MAMEHNYTATRTVEMAAGEKLVIKSEEVKLLDEKVPNGKTWAVTVKVEILETAS
jgi:hypothetical protein